MNSQTRSIVNGPSKSDLFGALQLRTGDRLIDLLFKTQVRGYQVVEYTFHILGIEVEDGSGTKFNLSLQDLEGLKRYVVFYDTGRRTGHITPID